MLKFLGDKIESTLTASTPLRSAGGSLAGATNASPIVVQTGSAHGLGANGSITALTDGVQANNNMPGNATVTSAGHGLPNGATVVIESVVGFDGLNNRDWTVTNATTNTFDLLGSQNVTGKYVSGGTWRVPFGVFVAGVTGLTAANGCWGGKATDSTHIALLGSVGNGTYGGSPIWWTVPSGAQFATVQAQVGDVNWLCDGTDPVAGDGGGVRMAAGDFPLRIDAAEFLKFRAINYSSGTGAELVVKFWRII